MKEKTIISLTRTICGTALFVVHMVTGYNGSAVLLSLVLLGVPIEIIKKEEEKP